LVAEPPLPEQVSEYTGEPGAAGVTVSEPEVARDPLQLSDAVQEVAPVDDHVSVVEWPENMFSGCALNVSVGAAGGGSLPLPPPPPPQPASTK
jgi:hypothetical protein